MDQQEYDEKARVDFFNTLYKENYTRVYNFICRSQLRKDTKLAEDIVQSTFCEAWNKLDILLTHPNQNGWLMETAKMKYWSQRKKKSTTEIGYDDCLEEPFTTESRYNTLELEMIIDEALSIEERELFTRYFVEKNPIKLMAQRENMSEGAFKVKMHRIRKKVQKQFNV